MPLQKICLCADRRSIAAINPNCPHEFIFTPNIRPTILILGRVVLIPSGYIFIPGDGNDVGMTLERRNQDLAVLRGRCGSPGV
jgi:hypothetical protein